MTAPTLVQCGVTRAAGTTALDLANVTSGGPTAGDLCVIIAGGSNGAVSTVTDVTYTVGGASAGFTSHLDQAAEGGANRLRIWSKILVADDYGASGDQRDLKSLTLAGWTNTGSARWGIFVLRHANGWDTDRVLEIDTQIANVANGSQVASIAKTRAGVMVTGLVSTASTVTLSYNGSAAIEPYMDESTTSDADGPLGTPAPASHGTAFGSGLAAAQADLQAYAAGSSTITITASAGLNNTTHVVGAIYFQVRDSAKTATITDAAGITDASRPRTHAAARTITDPAGITDTAGTAAPLTRTIIDTAGLTDQIPRAHAYTIADTAGLADVGTVLSSLPEPVNITDELTADVTRRLSDPAGLTDPKVVRVPGNGYALSTIGIADTIVADTYSTLDAYFSAVLASPRRTGLVTRWTARQAKETS